jgi:2-methylisocitrate lyase-like PEP mutase family enzyme
MADRERPGHCPGLSRHLSTGALEPKIVRSLRGRSDANARLGAPGLAGIGIEDSSGNPERPIRDFDEAVARVREAAKIAKGKIMLTGRTDNFIQGRPDLEDTIRRLVAFAEVGADVLYAPYPSDMDAVRAIVKAVAPKPVNILVGTMSGTLPWAELQKAGVKRVSMGSSLYFRVMGDLQKAARELAGGDLASASEGMDFDAVEKLISAAAATTA